MDTIAFVVVVESFGRSDGTRTIEPRINGAPLRELARLAEIGPATASGQPDLAGDYAGLDLRELRRPGRHYLGEPELPWGDHDTTVLLGCTCGEWGCWPLIADIDVDNSTIRWSGFRNGYRDWDLSTLGPFEFDRSAYESALEQVG